MKRGAKHQYSMRAGEIKLDSVHVLLSLLSNQPVGKFYTRDYLEERPSPPKDIFKGIYRIERTSATYAKLIMVPAQLHPEKITTIVIERKGMYDTVIWISQIGDRVVLAPRLEYTLNWLKKSTDWKLFLNVCKTYPLNYRFRKDYQAICNLILKQGGVETPYSKAYQESPYRTFCLDCSQASSKKNKEECYNADTDHE